MKTPIPELELMAYVDGELDAGARAAVESRLRQDPAARAEVAAWRAIREGLQAADPLVPVPESREFYWSSIRRRIEGSATRPDPDGDGVWAGWWRGWGRWMIPGTVALVLSVVVLTQRTSRMEVAIGGGRSETATTLTFHSDSDGMTIHWIN
jgi:anti-sigma-K factor RskA